MVDCFSTSPLIRASSEASARIVDQIDLSIIGENISEKKVTFLLP
jgi:hypothetical protein